MTSVFGANCEDWPDDELGKKLFSFEDLIQCKLCGDFYDNPQLLPCGHTFCYLCISKRFDRKLNPNATEACPQCKASAGILTLKLNREIFSIVESWKKVKELLLKALKSANEEDPFDDQDVDTKSSRSTSRSISTSKSHDSGSTSSIIPLYKKTAISKKLPLRSFHCEPLQKVKDALSTATKDSGVSISLIGDKSALEKRYRMLIHLINAQVDSPKPKSLEEVVAEINRSEQIKSIEAMKETKSLVDLNALKEGKETKTTATNFKNLIKRAKKAKSELTKKSSDETSAPAASDEPTAIPDDSDSPTAIGNKISEARPVEYSRGIWKVLMSEKLSRPFFFNTVTNTGQFAVPSELQGNRDDEILEEFEAQERLINNVSRSTTTATNMGVVGNSLVSSDDPLSIPHLSETYIRDDTNISDLSTSSRGKYQEPNIQSCIIFDDDDPFIQSDLHPGELGWTCDVCTLYNRSSDSASCEACSSTNPNIIKKLSQLSSSSSRNVRQFTDLNQSSKKEKTSSNVKRSNLLFANDSSKKQKLGPRSTIP